MVPIPAAIMEALGHANLQMNMHYVSLRKSHIHGQVENLNAIRLLPPAIKKMKAPAAPARMTCVEQISTV